MFGNSLAANRARVKPGRVAGLRKWESVCFALLPFAWATGLFFIVLPKVRAPKDGVPAQGIADGWHRDKPVGGWRFRTKGLFFQKVVIVIGVAGRA